MDYQKIYNSLIEKARSKTRKKSRDIYYENHHILPKSLGGDNSKKNLILLTAKEHFVAHKLLLEIYNNKEMIYAFFRMTHFSKKHHKRDYKISSREFERLKILLSDTVKQNWEDEEYRLKTLESIEKFWDSDENRIRNGEFTKKNFQNEDTRNKHKNSQQRRFEKLEEHDKLSIGLKKYYENPEAIQKNKDIQKEYWKDKKKPNEGREFSEEWIENIKKGQKKRFENLDERKKVSDFVKNQPPLVCPHCSKIGKSCVMYRHHFDNCKLKKQEVVV